MEQNGKKKFQTYKDLNVWQKALNLAATVFRATEDFHDGDPAGLSNRIRESSMLIPSSIAEGHGRRGEFKHYLQAAMASSCTLETQLSLACKLELMAGIRMNEILKELEDVRRMMGGLIKKVD